jgi:hypothetical protein
MKLFDYKFILILFLSLSIYFLYRRIEQLEEQFAKLQNNNPTNTDNKLLENNNILTLPLPKNPDENQSNASNAENSLNLNEILNMANNMVNDTTNNMEPDRLLINQNNETIELIKIPIVLNKNEEEHVIKNNVTEHINSIDLNNIEEYSNEKGYSAENNTVEIYSNDNTEENHSSLMESCIDAVNTKEDEINLEVTNFVEDLVNNVVVNVVNNKNNQIHDSVEESIEEIEDTKLNELLKNNKLIELQEIATKLNISLLRQNSNRKKTKLQLAKEILSKENNNQINL